jgi:hypothetical protein
MPMLAAQIARATQLVLLKFSFLFIFIGWFIKSVYTLIMNLSEYILCEIYSRILSFKNTKDKFLNKFTWFYFKNVISLLLSHLNHF